MTNKAFSALPATTSGALDYSATYMHVFDTSDKKLHLGELFAAVWGDSLRVTADGAAAGGAVVSGYGLTMYGTQLVRGSTSGTAGTIEHQSSTGTTAVRLVADPDTGEYRIKLDPDGTIGQGRVVIEVGGTEVVRVTGNGDLRLGSVTIDGPAAANVVGARLSAAGNLAVSNEDVAINANAVDDEGRGSGTAGRWRYQGNIVGSVVVSASGTAYNTTSDYRLKENLQPLENAADLILGLPVYRFRWVNAPQSPAVQGFLAHDVALVVPEAVTGEKDAVEIDPKTGQPVIDPKTGQPIPIYQQIDQAKLVPALWAWARTAVPQMAAMAEQISALEARIAALEAGRA